MSRHDPTPSQTVGPYLSLGLPWPDGADVVPEGTPGAVTVGGTVHDGDGDPVVDALIETWQADPDGRFDHPDDPRGARRPAVAGFRGFGRVPTGDDGCWSLRTVLPGALPVPGEDGVSEAPHLDVSVFARGLLDRVVTRIYFPCFAEANAADPLLAVVPAERRDTLVAVAEGAGRYRFDIRLQGAGETVFLRI
ncbi:protocatechuate 3,4-dioxygenase [Pseudonocardia sp. EC080610-09]|uniref:protocatechuate 3,4-dioxygenase subunit alpha n=1 Tax=unclassified Pseudonocardia TaxID=2619320 RepID=UPI0006CAF78C|nr:MULTISPECIES: protocatechuate 3,4-dioxygenase subunit alpha [unclassified Pseudonocardia]ALE74672.1 protocatechuate 3,4-dioxygenase [Pseudonocardia sp. EC080625-04]ALL78102.1 protocatechuate 3,4-dioxygenase [Pseudonocardia sp. EC080610-09]ALL81013.1 protocatechuate 3,4-dioxygenase [Pseudonocardia sp. EC080619-01]